MVRIKVNDIPDFLPSYCQDYLEEQNMIVEKEDWEEYLIALRQYTSAYFKLKDKIKKIKKSEK